MKAYILTTEVMTASPIYNFGSASFKMTGEFIFFPQSTGELGIKKGLFIQIKSKEEIGRTFCLHFLPRVFESHLLFSKKGMKKLKAIKVSKDIYEIAKNILLHEIKMAELLESNSEISGQSNPKRFINAIKQEENEYHYKQLIESEKKER